MIRQKLTDHQIAGGTAVVPEGDDGFGETGVAVVDVDPLHAVGGIESPLVAALAAAVHLRILPQTAAEGALAGGVVDDLLPLFGKKGHADPSQPVKAGHQPPDILRVLQGVLYIHGVNLPNCIIE